MKNLKKIASFVLVLTLIFAMAITASAAEATVHTITIAEDPDAPRAGHRYEVYQIFTGIIDQNSTGDDVLVDVHYGTGYRPDGKFIGDPVSPAELVAITDAEAFAKDLVDNNKLKDVFRVLDETNNWTASSVPSGYYLIIDKTTDHQLDSLDSTRSAYIVKVVYDVNMAPKNSKVTNEKKVKDVNDSTGEKTDWQDSADHDIGDTVEFQITSTFTDIAEFDDYEIEIEDTMSKGLTYNNDVKVELTYTTINPDNSTSTATIDVTDALTKEFTPYTGTEPKYVDGNVLKLSHTNIKSLVSGNLKKAVFTTTYTTTLNEQAVVGEDGNPNKVTLTYDRDPNNGSKGTTPADVNIVFTFKSDITKTNAHALPLKGASFKLEKFVADPAGTQEVGGVKGDWALVKEIATGDGTDENIFAFNGLDDGTYKLTETKVPDGYNSIKPMVFTVTAEHDIVSDDPKLTDLKADGGEALTLTVTKADGSMNATVINHSGVQLPETGGIGTTIFYVVGGVLVVVAVIFLVTRRRMNKA